MTRAPVAMAISNKVQRSSQNNRWTDHRGDEVLRCGGLDMLNTVSLCLASVVASRVLRVLTMAVMVTVTTVAVPAGRKVVAIVSRRCRMSVNYPLLWQKLWD
jgi:hypothetical protein